MTEEERDQANVALMLDEAIEERVVDALMNALMNPNGTSPIVPMLYRRLREHEQRQAAKSAQMAQSSQSNTHTTQMQTSALQNPTYSQIQSGLLGGSTQSPNGGTVSDTIERLKQEYEHAVRK